MRALEQDLRVSLSFHNAVLCISAQEDGSVRELHQDLEHSHCHGHGPPADSSRREALLRLAVTSAFCFLFMVRTEELHSGYDFFFFYKACGLNSVGCFQSY